MKQCEALFGDGSDPGRDRTPAGYTLPPTPSAELFKTRARLIIYPLLNVVTTQLLKRRPYCRNLCVNRILWGERGNDLAAHRRRLNRVASIAGKRVLIGGCGLGREILSWVDYAPAAIVAVDLFNYRRAWEALRERIARINSHLARNITFYQADLADMSGIIDDGSVDIVATEALLEHCRDTAGVLREIRRILRPGGYLYSTWGPLYCCWSGDHVSGSDGLENGYNHLLMEGEEYRRYICSIKTANNLHGEDERIWVQNGLLSYLRFDHYLSLLARLGEIKYLGVIISPEAIRFRQSYPSLWGALMREKGHREFDLVCKAVTAIVEVTSSGDLGGADLGPMG